MPPDILSPSQCMRPMRTFTLQEPRTELYTPHCGLALTDDGQQQPLQSHPENHAGAINSATDSGYNAQLSALLLTPLGVYTFKHFKEEHKCAESPATVRTITSILGQTLRK